VAVKVSRFSTKGAAILLAFVDVGMFKLMDLHPVTARITKARQVAVKKLRRFMGSSFLIGGL
jgi:hypothetical protein